MTLFKPQMYQIGGNFSKEFSHLSNFEFLFAPPRHPATFPFGETPTPHRAGPRK